MKYTEDDLREAFKNGIVRGEFLERDEYAPFFVPLDEDEYIESLKEITIKEDKIPFTYSFLRRKIDWEKFCDLTGTNIYSKNEGFEFKDSDIYYITESKAKQFNLI